MSEGDILKIYEANRDVLYRTCYLYMGNEEDAADAVQNTLVKLMERTEPFEDDHHARNWLLKVAVNECRKTLSHWWRKKRAADIEDFDEFPYNGENLISRGEILDAVMHLPKNSRIAIYLYYFEGCSTMKIAEILGRNTVTVRSDLARGRKKLKLDLEAEGERRGEAR